MNRVARRNMNRENGRANIFAADGALPVAPVSARVEQPPQAVPPVPALAPLNAEELAPYKCNHCKEYVRGGVITICGHLFCWTCLWPFLADKPSPECPRCQTSLILYEDIVPFYGEGPNARPEDCNVLAEPGAVPRPTGICLNKHDQEIGEDLEIDEEMLAEDNLNGQPATPGGLCPRIERTVACLKWLQIVCAALIGLIWCFISLT